jgi:peptide-methionine (S)-S-oxide reductase
MRTCWKSHVPGIQSWSRQYRAAVFFQNEAQKRLALKSREQVAATLKGRVYTEILPATRFYLAEDYHQKYFLRRVPELLREYRAIYPNPEDFVSSTAVARVNGYLAGYGTRAGLQRDLPGLGLSEAGGKLLLKLVRPAPDAGVSLGCPVVR